MYNKTAAVPATLVFFADAVEHITRIARILRQPRGSALLVGVSGSGKQALTRFVAFLHGAACFQPNVGRSYSASDFRSNLRVRCHDVRPRLLHTFRFHQDLEAAHKWHLCA